MAGELASIPDPQTGWPVWGNPNAVAALKRAVDHGPGHAYILTGREGVGKKLAAITFAQTLNCLARTEHQAPCGRCPNCRRISRRVFADVTQFDLASQAERERDKSRNLTLNISTVREVSAAVAYRPLEARWRVVIVDDVETMQETAQEAFLKTLEEPPSYAVILLVTRDSDLLLPTIQSRCTVIRFADIPTETIKRRLESGGVDAVRSQHLATLSQGSMGWAIEAIATPTLADERQAVVEAARALIDGDGHTRSVTALRLADEFGGNRESVFAQLGVVQGVWRDRLLASARTDISTGRDLAGLTNAIRSVDGCIANLEANVRPRLALLSMLESWPETD
jgi:DNA polymerase III delta' subunit